MERVLFDKNHDHMPTSPAISNTTVITSDESDDNTPKYFPTIRSFLEMSLRITALPRPRDNTSISPIENLKNTAEHK